VKLNQQPVSPPLNKGAAFLFLSTFSAFFPQIPSVSSPLSKQENFKHIEQGYTMNIKALLSTLLVASAVLGSSSAMAYQGGYSNNTINLGALEALIDSGVATGKLTRGEERVLRSELKNLRSTVRIALKDHRLSSKERNAIERKESKLKSNIYKLSNNRLTTRGSRYDRHDNNWRDDSRGHNEHNGYNGTPEPRVSMHNASNSVGHIK
jgi:hypothetical protein